MKRQHRLRGLAGCAALLLAWTMPLQAATPTAPVRALLERNFGPRAAQIQLQQAAPDDGANWYQASATGGRLTVRGSDPVALAHGAYAYLNAIGAASVSWEGDRVQWPARLPDRQGARVASPFAHRAYLNTCTYGYTTPFWGWSRWQREIDWMALHGIDMPLAMEGQEAIWQQLWREFGVGQDQLQDYFSGPAFTPWQRMGNIEGYRAPLPQSWIDGKRELQKKILARMRELGMKPVLPAFAGYVPKAFALAHPQARIYRMRAWEGFHETYWLDPADPLFARIAARFIALYTQAYGEGEYYLADAFNEMLPPVADDGSDIAAAKYGDSTANTDAARARAVPAAQRDARLAGYGEAIYRSIAQANPGATWVMQGWLFGADREFWQPQAIAAFLSRVPDAKMLVLDIGNDRYPGTWKASQAFDGKRWVYGYVHNYGGSNPLYGDFSFYRQDLQALLADPGHANLSGFGVFPEGLHSNSIVYEYLYSLAWEGPGQAWGDWLGQYLRARYGHADPRLLAAWNDLETALYHTRYWSPRWWRQHAGAYLLFKRPDAQALQFEPVPGDQAALRRALQALLAMAGDYADAPLFRYDLLEYLRHYASMRGDALIQQAMADYQRGDFAAGDRARQRLQSTVEALDGLLGGQQETLGSWLDEARAASPDPALQRYYVANAKAQVSVWGGQGNLADYASKGWQGMYRDFYLQRWLRFLAAWRDAAAQGRPFDQAAFQADMRAWEWQWAESDGRYPRRLPADPLAAADALMKELDAP